MVIEFLKWYMQTSGRFLIYGFLALIIFWVTVPIAERIYIWLKRRGTK